MAYRPDDPYNIGIGTPYLGNINMGQVPVNNIELAKTFNTRQGLLDIGAAEKGKVYGYNPTVVGDFIGTSKKLQGSQNPVTGGGDIGSIKTWMTDPKRQHIYEDYLDKSGTQFIPEIQKALEQGLFKNRDDFGNQLLYEEAIKNKGDQAFLDDEWDFSNIEGHLASRDLNYVPESVFKQQRFKQHQLMNRRKQDMQQRIREAEDAETNRIAKEKADAAAAAAKKQYSGQGAQGGGGGTNIGGGQQTSSGIAGGAISHGAAKAARGSMSGWGLADGGIVQLLRYGGMVDG